MISPSLQPSVTFGANGKLRNTLAAAAIAVSTAVTPVGALYAATATQPQAQQLTDLETQKLQLERQIKESQLQCDDRLDCFEKGEASGKSSNWLWAMAGAAGAFTALAVGKGIKSLDNWRLYR